MRNVVIITIVAVSCFATQLFGETITLSGTSQCDDLTMRSGWVVAGNSTLNYVGMYTNGNPSRTALRFAVAANTSGLKASQITSATISLNVAIASTSYIAGTYDMYRLRRDFNEDSFTSGVISTTRYSWLDASLGAASDGSQDVLWGTPGADSTTTDRYDTVDATFASSSTSYVLTNIDVTQYVKDVLNGAADLGWIIKASVENPATLNSMKFRATEYASGGPVMTIEYSAIPEPMTIMLLAGGIIPVIMRRRAC